MDPVCFPITFRGIESLSLGFQRAKEWQKERKAQSLQGGEEERASRPEVFDSLVRAGSTLHFPSEIRSHPFSSLVSPTLTRSLKQCEDEEVEATGWSENLC